MPERNLSNEDLIALAQAGDLNAQEEILGRWAQVVRAMARSYYLPGSDRDDLVQEGMIGLLKAVRDYRASKGAFVSFARLCVSRQIITALKTSTRQKHSVLNRAYSIDAPIPGSSLDGVTVLDRIADVDTVESTLFPVENEGLQVILEAQTILTPHEFRVFRLYGLGYNYAEIAESLGRTLKSIDNAVFKVKLKLRRRLEEIEQHPRDPLPSRLYSRPGRR